MKIENVLPIRRRVSIANKINSIANLGGADTPYCVMTNLLQTNQLLARYKMDVRITLQISSFPVFKSIWQRQNVPGVKETFLISSLMGLDAMRVEVVLAKRERSQPFSFQSFRDHSTNHVQYSFRVHLRHQGRQQGWYLFRQRCVRKTA